MVKKIIREDPNGADKRWVSGRSSGKRGGSDRWGPTL